jgi:hypothetical protein
VLMFTGSRKCWFDAVLFFCHEGHETSRAGLDVDSGNIVVEVFSLFHLPEKECNRCAEHVANRVARPFVCILYIILYICVFRFGAAFSLNFFGVWMVDGRPGRGCSCRQVTASLKFSHDKARLSKPTRWSPQPHCTLGDRARDPRQRLSFHRCESWRQTMPRLQLVCFTC